MINNKKQALIFLALGLLCGAANGELRCVKDNILFSRVDLLRGMSSLSSEIFLVETVYSALCVCVCVCRGREAAAGLDPTEPAEGTARALCPGRLCVSVCVHLTHT